MPDSKPKTVAEIESFVTLLRVACEDTEVYELLERLLTLPDDHRKLVLNTLLLGMRKANAPQDFLEAMACLVETEVAEKAYEIIFKCQRSIPF